MERSFFDVDRQRSSGELQAPVPGTGSPVPAGATHDLHVDDPSTQPMTHWIFAAVHRRRLVATLLWIIVAVLPALALDVGRSAPRVPARVVGEWFGELARPYLSSTPAPLVIYLLAASFASWVVLFLLIEEIAPRLHAGHSGDAVIAVISATGRWAVLWGAGLIVLSVVLAVRRSDFGLASNWGLRLFVLGCLDKIPTTVVVTLSCLAARKTWRRSALTLLGCIGAAMWGVASREQHWDGPAPAIVTAKLFSGRAEYIQSAAVNLFEWVLGASLMALVVLRLRGRMSKRALMSL